MNDRLNIVVPMAGRGSRFADAGYEKPKPLIDVGGKPMIQWVIDNIRPGCSHRFIFICQRAHMEEYPEVRAALESLCPGCVVIEIDGVTEGAACTVLKARDYIDTEEPLMIANSDQYVECCIDDYLGTMESQDADGLIMTFWADDPKWSYCKMRDDGTVSEVVEKVVVSDKATVGIYNFRQGCDFVREADRMIANGWKSNGEYYVAPVYTLMAENGKRLVTYDIGSERKGMYGLGIPEDLEFFKTTEVFGAQVV